MMLVKDMRAYGRAVCRGEITKKSHIKKGGKEDVPLPLCM